MDEQTPAPWAPPTAPAVADEPARGDRRGRRRLALGALAAVALGGAAVVAVGQFGGGDAAATSDADPDDAADADATTSILGAAGTLGDVGTCLAGELGLDLPESADSLDDLDLDAITALTPDQLAAAWEACAAELDEIGTWLDELPGLDQLPDLDALPAPGDWGDLDRALDGVVECLGPIVQDLAPEQEGDATSSGATVTVVGPDGVVLYELGEGDGSVVVTKDGDQVTVEATGDVEEFDVGATIDEGVAALEECDLGLPFDLEVPELDWLPGSGD